MLCVGLSAYSPKIAPELFSIDNAVSYLVTPSEDTTIDAKKTTEETSGHWKAIWKSYSMGSIPVKVLNGEKFTPVVSLSETENTSKEMWRRLAIFVERCFFCVQVMVYTFLVMGALYFQNFPEN